MNIIKKLFLLFLAISVSAPSVFCMQDDGGEKKRKRNTTTTKKVSKQKKLENIDLNELCQYFAMLPDDVSKIIMYKYLMDTYVKGETGREFIVKLEKFIRVALNGVLETEQELLKIEDEKETERLIGKINILQNLREVEENILSRCIEVETDELLDQDATFLFAKLGHLDLFENILERRGNSGKIKSRALRFAGNGEVAQHLLDEGIRIDQRDENGFTALHHAASNGSPDVVEFILKKALDLGIVQKLLQTRDRHGLVPLHHAAMSGDIETVRILLEYGTDVNVSFGKQKRKSTPFHFACEYGHKAVAEFLLQKVAKIIEPREFDETPLMLAASSNNYELLEFLLNNGAKSEINRKSTENRQRTALSCAVENGNIEAVQLLLNNGADINIGDLLGEIISKINSKLYRSKDPSKYYRIMNFLLDNGIVVRSSDLESAKSLTDGTLEILMDKAFEQKHLRKIKGARHDRRDITFKDNQGRGFIHRAIKCENEKVLQEVLKKCSQKNLIEIVYLSLKDLMLRENLEKVFSFLLEKKDFDPNSLDEHENTILHLIAQDGQVDIIKFLLEHPVFREVLFQQLSVQNENGDTPLHLAIENGHLDFVNHLLLDQRFFGPLREAFKMQNRKGDTPLHLAVRNKNAGAVNVLLNHQIFQDLLPNILFMERREGTLLHIALMNVDLETLNILINNEIVKHYLPDLLKINGKTSLGFGTFSNPMFFSMQGITPFLLAVQKGLIEVVEYFLTIPGAEEFINIPNANGDTPLHIAVRNGDFEMFKLLLRPRTIINKVNRQGLTPFLLAVNCLLSNEKIENYKKIILIFLNCDKKITDAMINLSSNPEIKSWLMNIKKQQDEQEERLQQERFKRIKVAMDENK